MESCPNCNKKIRVKVSGKYTCSCGESIVLKYEAEERKESTLKHSHIKDWILNLNENIFLFLFILFGVAVFAWDSDFPELFGSYSGIIWIGISYIFLLCCSILFLFLVFVLYFGITEKRFGFKHIFILISLLVGDLGFILFFLNDVGLIETGIPLIGTFL